MDGGRRTDTFIGPEAALAVTVLGADWPYSVGVEATGDDPAGRGARLPIPLHLVLEAQDLSLAPGIAREWRLRLSVAQQEGEQSHGSFTAGP
jgi:hypothetical protein